MNPYRTYQQQTYSAWLRIDMVIALFDATIEKMEAAQAALQKNDRAAAKPLLARARIMVTGLVSCVNPAQGEMATQFLRLYEFVFRTLGNGSLKDVEGALKVMRTLREGLEGIRPEAAQLERSGQIPSITDGPKIQLTV